MTDATIETTNVVEREKAQYSKAQQADSPAALLVHAARASGRSAFSVAMEARRYRKSKAEIRLWEYVKFGLYDHARHTEKERGEFISMMLQNKCLHAVNDVSWFGVTEDKWNSSMFLDADGVPVPDTLGMIDASGRRYHGGKGIATPEDLKALLTGGVDFPLFGKHNKGLGSVGVFIIDDATADYILLRDVGEMSYSAFFRNVIGQDAFILQRCVENCDFIRTFSRAAATVRMVNMIDGDGIYTPAAVLKLPAKGNPADNFWREGNLLANIDPETGEVLTLVGSDGPVLKSHDSHPDQGAAIIGQKLPHWDRLLEVNAHVAHLHAPLKYQSNDIAITNDGPVVIEVNAGSSFTLPQYASGKGFMTDRVRALFKQHGADFL
ncbi:sugar-transfer associated ATP-grasp domain-containing protein [Pseudaestuariivita atlantica]|uniref:Alpha-L-glutamate ligase-related protein ATP-grasp domain-containing protein n=1 Tax=Pseudaestuariivita atlantica TaxID=1317121 RepID=A0A0L1JVG3_9RHOB|nr:sugar-transfer associated ATP-grasp domain-containing protein [Pseudaestuariivita atlantica]KNG95383.1 hypothetical protein ATO11_01865 [Pseudaestuariivita atlantica]